MIAVTTAPWRDSCRDWREPIAHPRFNSVSMVLMSLIDDRKWPGTDLPESVALAIARDEYPHLQTEHCHALLDVWAEQARERFRTLLDGPQRNPNLECAALCNFIYRDLGFRGSDDYDDPRSHFLNHVLEARSGSPVAMAVVVIAIGERLGVRVDPVAFPGHVLVRVGGDDGVYLDPYDGGFPLPRQALQRLAAETLDDELEATRRLEPVGARTVGVRMLLNLQRIYHTRQDHARSMVVCDRLFELTGAPLHRCDRGLHALALGASEAAIADLEAYLASHPTARDADKVRAVLDRARNFPAQLN